MNAVTINVQMDINKIIKEKVEKISKKLFFEVVKTTYSYITVDALSAGGDFGSPVWTGRYHASHTISINNIDKSTKGEGIYSSQLPISNAASLESRFNIGDTVYIANSLDYADDIENKGASPFKTPDGVYRVSAEAVKARFANGITVGI